MGYEALHIWKWRAWVLRLRSMFGVPIKHPMSSANQALWLDSKSSSSTIYKIHKVVGFLFTHLTLWKQAIKLKFRCIPFYNKLLFSYSTLLIFDWGGWALTNLGAQWFTTPSISEKYYRFCFCSISLLIKQRVGLPIVNSKRCLELKTI